jgi:cytoskeleton protein RodZ
MENNTPQTTEASETVGEILRNKREEIGLSLDEITEKLNLDSNLIELLENNDFEKFKVETYLKGYLRAYSKLLGIDGDRIIKLYKESNPEKEPEILPDVKPKKQKNSSDRSVKLFSYIIGLSIVLSMLIWYQKNITIKPDANNNNIGNIELNKNNKINGVDTSYKIITHSDYWQWPIDNIPDRYRDSGENDNSKSVKNEKIKDNIKENVIQEEVLETEESPIYETQQSADTVVLNLRGDSWIEIYDREGNRLFLDLARSGKNYIINGDSPFDILLGAANEVSVEFNGSLVNIEPYIRYGIARFTLPTE